MEKEAKSVTAVLSVQPNFIWGKLYLCSRTDVHDEKARGIVQIFAAKQIALQ